MKRNWRMHDSQFAFQPSHSKHVYSDSRMTCVSPMFLNREIDKSNHYVCECVYSLHYVCPCVYSIHLCLRMRLLYSLMFAKTSTLFTYVCEIRLIYSLSNSTSNSLSDQVEPCLRARLL